MPQFYEEYISLLNNLGMTLFKVHDYDKAEKYVS